MCLSGIDAIALADQLIRAGEFDVVVAGGQESMTKAPHLLMDSRSGYKYGDVTVLDHMAYDGLHDVFTDQPMGALTEQRNDVDKFTRAEQDEFAARSHQRPPRRGRTASSPTRSCRCKIPQRKGDPIEFTEDEGIRANTTAESLAGLKPAFRKDGTITAGSASQISDGACAVVVMNKAKAEELGLSWLVRDRRARRGRRPRLDAAEPARQRHQEGDRPRRHLASTSSTSSRSTRRSRRSRWPRPRNSASTPTRSTSTAAPSRSATRSACRVRASPCTPPLNWPDGGSGYAVAALCGAGGQGDALVLRALSRLSASTTLCSSWRDFGHNGGHDEHVRCPRTVAGWFRFIAFAEAVSWVGLLVGMYFKYLGSPRTEIGVKVFGMAHGLVFIAFVVVALLVGIAFKWGAITWLLALLASIVPLGSVIFLIWADRTGRWAP